jgi:apolipoprotein N-acyltransferase
LLDLLKKNFLDLIYVFFLGAISSYSLPPYNFFIINFITFSLFFIFLFSTRKKYFNHKYFFKYGWFFGLGYFLFSLYWISISLTFDESFRFLIPFSLVLLPIFLSIFYGLITYLFSIFYYKDIVSSLLIFSILFGTVEFVRGSILTGFPWNLIAFSFSENIFFIQILSVIGTYAFNLISITLFSLPAILILKKTKKEIVVFCFFIILTVSFLIFGNLKIKQFNSMETIKNLFTVRVVSSNISLDRFYSKKDELEIINELILLSSSEKKEPTIYLWPEGIIPDSDISDINFYSDLFSENFGNEDLIIIGINNVEKKNNESLFFNSMAIFNNKLDLIESYNKVNLVPFGEFIPFENILSLIGFKTITNNYQSYSRGDNRMPFDINTNKVNLKFLPLICYEIIYSGKLSKNKNFDYIVNISEDGWFGNSIGPKQHFSHSIFRSIESGKYVIRSANNGISAIINPMGIIEQKIDFGLTGYLDFKERRLIKPTPFMIYGNKIFLLLILIYIFLIFSFIKLKNE